MKSFALPESVVTVFSTLEQAGYQVYAVGGCVRDLLMGRPTEDWDFTTNATPHEILKLFPDGFYNNVFGTVGIPVQKHLEGSDSSTKGLLYDKESVSSDVAGKNLKTPRGSDSSQVAQRDSWDDVTARTEQIYEITTFRTEHGYSDRRHPDKVFWGKSIEDDLARRDFTINSIAYDGKQIVDPFKGQQDIEKKLIRAVGDAKQRFSEDALRMMRAIRIATELQFIIEEQTFQAIRTHVSSIRTISQERIRDELLKIIETDFPADGFMLLKNSSLLAEILPELDRCFGIPQQSPKRHHIYDVGTHLIKSLQFCPSKDPIVRLATVLHDIGKYETFKKTDEGIITFYNHEIVGAKLMRAIVDRLRFSRHERERLLRLVRFHQFTVDERQTDSAIRRFIRNVGKENLDDMLALRTGDRLGGGARETSWRLELYKKRLEEVQVQPFSVADLKVDGNDVMKILNIKPGPMVGKVLNALFAEVEDDLTKNERDYLLKRIPEVSKTIK